MADTLLTYTFTTDSNPLQINVQGSVSVLATNPGGYSDVPAEDDVSVTSIVLDFGTLGAGGADLTNDADTIAVAPPATEVSGETQTWGVSQNGLQFTFTPPRPAATRSSPATGSRSSSPASRSMRPWAQSR